MSAIAEKVNTSDALAEIPMQSDAARPLTSMTPPVLCVGLVALGVGAVAIGLAAEEAADG
jgi:hypothetical protein